MASTTSANGTGRSIYSFPANDAKIAIREVGSYVKEDASAGCRASEFIAKVNPLRKVVGLDFCAQNSFYDKVNYTPAIHNSI
jgi:hypothetical protein